MKKWIYEKEEVKRLLVEEMGFYQSPAHDELFKGNNFVIVDEFGLAFWKRQKEASNRFTNYWIGYVEPKTKTELINWIRQQKKNSMELRNL